MPKISIVIPAYNVGDFFDIVWACIVHDNRLDVGESLIPYRIKTFLQVIADIVCGNDD